tara:strand:- start:721 stop:993 length:273 start_codon:yes stop_codon:yes gene_type:complete
MKPTYKRNMLFIFLLLFTGAAAGTALSIFVGLTMPDGVVRDFFLNSKPLGWDPFTLNLQIITLTTGFTIDISVASIFGMAFAWYFLRYFR